MRSKKLITCSFLFKSVAASQEFVSTGRQGKLWGSLISLQTTCDDDTELGPICRLPVCRILQFGTR